MINGCVLKSLLFSIIFCTRNFHFGSCVHWLLHPFLFRFPVSNFELRIEELRKHKNTLKNGRKEIVFLDFFKHTSFQKYKRSYVLVQYLSTAYQLPTITLQTINSFLDNGFICKQRNYDLFIVPTLEEGDICITLCLSVKFRIKIKMKSRERKGYEYVFFIVI